MLKTRIIPVLLLKNGVLVRSRNFNFHQSTGNHVEQVKRFSDWNADEIIYLDITRNGGNPVKLGMNTIGTTSSYSRIELNHSSGDILGLVSEISRVCCVPLTIGGGVRTIDDIRRRLIAGADKVAINTMALEVPTFISEASKQFGSQCIVLSVDVRKAGDIWKVYKNFGTEDTGLDVRDWIIKTERLGAGEILLQSIDRDGVGQGYDIDLLDYVKGAVDIPIIMLGGVGKFEHFAEGYSANKSIGLAAANIFHFTEHSIIKARKHLITRNVPVTNHGG
jgi:cyclase